MKDLDEILKTNSPLPLNKRTVINVTYTSSILKDSILACLKVFDLSIEQFNVLRILRGQKGSPTNLQDIQLRMVNKMSNTTRLVDKLIIKGLVRRIVCKANRRKIEIFINESGLELLKKIDPIIDKTEDHLVSNLSKGELRTLNELLTKLRS